MNLPRLPRPHTLGRNNQLSVRLNEERNPLRDGTQTCRSDDGHNAPSFKTGSNRDSSTARNLAGIRRTNADVVRTHALRVGKGRASPVRSKSDLFRADLLPVDGRVSRSKEKIFVSNCRRSRICFSFLNSTRQVLRTNEKSHDAFARTCPGHGPTVSNRINSCYKTVSRRCGPNIIFHTGEGTGNREKKNLSKFFELQII